MIIHRSAIRLWTHIAQFLCVLALAATAVAIMAPRRSVEAPTPTQQADSAGSDSAQADGMATDDSQKAPASSIEQHDWTQLASVIDSIRKPIEGQADSAATIASADAGAEKSADTAPGSEDEPKPNPAPPGWRYVGYATTSGGGISALIDINSKQRFVTKGATVESFVVVQIDRQRLLIERDGRRFEVTLATPAPFDPMAVAAGARGRARMELERSRNARQQQINKQNELVRRGVGDPGGSSNQ